MSDRSSYYLTTKTNYDFPRPNSQNRTGGHVQHPKHGGHFYDEPWLGLGLNNGASRSNGFNSHDGVGFNHHHGHDYDHRYGHQHHGAGFGNF